MPGFGYSVGGGGGIWNSIFEDQLTEEVASESSL